MGLQGGQGILFSPDLLRQRAVQGGIGQRRTLSAIGRDQVHNGLGLGQPQLAVQEGTAGVLARGGGGGTGCDAAFHQPPGHRTAAVAGKLHHILAGVAVRCPEEEGHALVKGFLPFHEMPKQSSVALGIFYPLCRVGRAEHLCRHGIALRAGKTHHGNAACAGRGCNGRDR